MIEMKNVTKSFRVKESKKFFSKRKNVNIISDLSIQIPRGKIIVLLGINGAGKSTTIKMLSTLLIPDSGEIFIDGQNIKNMYKSYKSKINLISGGEKSLYLRLTAKENLEYFGSLYSISKSRLNIIINDTLKIVGLENIDLPVELYSKGMKQRLQIAKGLINNPDYIFLDEPTLGLDIKISSELKKYIKFLAYNEGKGLLLTTHYIKEAEELCDYIYIIDNGKIILEGNSDSIIKKIGNKSIYIVSFTGANMEVLQKKYDKRMKSINDINQISFQEEMYTIEEVLNDIKQCNCTLLDVKKHEPNLEDSLLKFTESNKN